MQIGVEVDLDDTVANGVEVVLLAGAGATVEDEEHGLLLLGLLLLLHVLLVLLEELWAELNVAGLVDSVHVAEASGDGEVWGDWGEGLVDVVDVLGLGVEGVVVHILVVDTVLLTSSDTNLHLEELLHWCGALEVLSGCVEVLLDGLLGQIDHVGGEERSAVLLEESLVGIEHAVQPWEELLGAVVGVEDDGNAVRWSDGADVVSGGDGSSDGCLLVLVLNTLAGEVGGTALAHLEDHWCLGIASGLEGCNDGGGGGDVDGGNGIVVVLGVLEERLDVVWRQSVLAGALVGGDVYW